jgi:radical SAM protein with 4Fe4S-binding SPASM domain
MDILEKISNLEVTEKTKLNILRKSTFVDDVVLSSDGLPQPSWIDISITELCNRLCEFCPRIDVDLYPNQNLHLAVDLADKIRRDLDSMTFKGGIVLSGYGEPLLHPKLYDIIKSFHGIHLEIVTNGDKLSCEVVNQLFEAGLSFICVSMYDGPHQIEHFTEMFAAVGVGQERYILRDRWHKETDSFGLKLTNRSGVLKFGPNPELFSGKPCHYTAYSMAIDWNGDVLLCVQDWNKKLKLGNVSNQSVSEIWRSIAMHKIRRKLINGRRNFSPCNNCNADGTVHGFNHVNAWERVDSE